MTCGRSTVNLEALAERKSRDLGGNMLPLGLGDFFFDPDDPLHPDFDGDEDED